MDAKIRLRVGQLRKFRAMSQMSRDSDLAAAMGSARQTVTRTVNGNTELSARFIASLLTVFPHLAFDDLFEVLPSEDEEQVDDEAGAA